VFDGQLKIVVFDNSYIILHEINHCYIYIF